MIFYIVIQEAFTKHQVWLLLNYHPELVIEIGIDVLLNQSQDDK